MSSVGGGWTLIGEKGKYIALSPQRFVDNSFGSTAENQQVTVRGSPGERVEVMLVPPPVIFNKQPRCVLDCRQPLRTLLSAPCGEWGVLILCLQGHGELSACTDGDVLGGHATVCCAQL